VTIASEALPDDPAALKGIITAMAQDAANAQAEIARLKFQLARFRRAAFGRSSEKLARESEQLELAIETLETDQTERLAVAAPEAAAIIENALRRSPLAVPYPITCRARRSCIAPPPAVRAAATRCGGSARM
jgi:hypothetical protein